MNKSGELRLPYFWFSVNYGNVKNLKNKMNQTIHYYNQNADHFFDTTYQVDMTSLYQSFLRYLPEHASILDLGCGSGRDMLALKIWVIR